MPQYLFLWCVKLCKRNFVQNSICKCFWKQVGKNNKKKKSISLPSRSLSACLAQFEQHASTLTPSLSPIDEWGPPIGSFSVPQPLPPSLTHRKPQPAPRFHDDAPTPTSLGLSRLRVVADLAPLSPSSFPHSQPQPSVWTVRKTTAEALQTRHATSRWIKPPLPPFAVPVSSPTPRTPVSTMAAGYGADHANFSRLRWGLKHARLRSLSLPGFFPCETVASGVLPASSGGSFMAPPWTSAETASPTALIVGNGLASFSSLRVLLESKTVHRSSTSARLRRASGGRPWWPPYSSPRPMCHPSSSLSLSLFLIQRVQAWSNDQNHLIPLRLTFC